jgi:hypothetical protein
VGESPLAFPWRRALSSAGERSLHTGEVVGSIPTAPTIKYFSVLHARLRRNLPPCPRVDPPHAPGGNRPQQGRWTQLILPVSGCDTNASVRVRHLTCSWRVRLFMGATARRAGVAEIGLPSFHQPELQRPIALEFQFVSGYITGWNLEPGRCPPASRNARRLGCIAVVRRHGGLCASKSRRPGGMPG